MDVTMPVMGGLSATDEITNADPKAKILLFTMHGLPNLAEARKSSGAKGLLIKASGVAELRRALRISRKRPIAL
jgi:two-component system, NarL family, invasion response regulator UvrY